jgi:phosphotriesterase-related protein
MLREISARTGINVLMGLGRYREPFYEPDLQRRTTRDLADEFVREATEGVDGILPAVIGEIGVDGTHLSPIEERVHRAAARAHLATGLPITTHAIQTNAGLMQLELFEEEGVDLAFVAVGHCDSFLSDEYHDRVVARGAYASFDLIRGVDPRTTERQARAVARLIRAGHGEQILISQDVCYHALLKAYGGNGYTFILKTFLDVLYSHAVTEAEARKLLVDNPARFLSGRPAKAET